MGGTYIRNFICNFISHRKKEEKNETKKKEMCLSVSPHS